MLSSIASWLAGIGVLIAALVAGWFAAKRSGEKAVQAKETEEALKESKDARDIDAKVHSISDADLASGLRDFERKK